MSRKKEKPIKQQAAYFDEVGQFHPRSTSVTASQAAQLPAVSQEVIDFLQRFASCQLECCGFWTLRLKPPTAWDKRWEFRRATALRSVQLEIEKARGVKAAVLWIPEIRCTIYKDDWLMLLEFLEENMEKSKQWTQFAPTTPSTQIESF